MKDTFDRKVKEDIFEIGDPVLKWDATRQEKGNMEGLMLSRQVHLLYHQCSKTTLLFSEIWKVMKSGGPFNGRFLKLYFS